MSLYEGGCEAKSVQAPVPAAVSELHAAIKTAFDACAQLEGRLGSVLESTAPDCAKASGANVERGPVCELHGELKSAASLVKDLSARVYHLTSRLAL